MIVSRILGMAIRSSDSVQVGNSPSKLYITIIIRTNK